MNIKQKINNYIQTVKGRTEEEKKKAAITWTITLTAIIFIIWAITFSYSAINRQNEDARLREEARLKAMASTTVAVASPKNSWSAKLGDLVVGGASLVSEGFWTVGSWLHK